MIALTIGADRFMLGHIRPVGDVSIHCLPFEIVNDQLRKTLDKLAYVFQCDHDLDYHYTVLH